MLKTIKNHPRKILAISFLLLLFYWFSLPKPLFQMPTCMVLEDQKGNLLGARIAADGQWRFPHQTAVPDKFAAAIIEFEDRRFYNHLGIDPVGIGRAMQQNFKHKRIVSGGSTLSMQVIRMAQNTQSRDIFQKIKEMILSTRLELGYSKKEILAFYTSNAPFGGNVVGLDAASWRYFRKNPEALSWSEAATLAVLPNAPALIHPGRNRDALRAKRNRLLKRLLEKDAIDETTYELALQEKLPEKPHRLPRLAPHLLDKVYSENFKGVKGKITRMQTTIDKKLQQRVTTILQRHNRILKSNDIHNLAGLVVEIETGNVVAYVGNILGTGREHSEEVDIIKAPRSTGSILKPILLAHMLDDGTVLPNSLIPDVPTNLGSYRPENYNETYDGMVPAQKAVIRSLNVPLVRMLARYGLEKFHFNLQQLGFYSIDKPADWYGLPLIVGGAESSLWEIVNAYAGMARTLNHFHENNGEYLVDDFRALNYKYTSDSSTSVGMTNKVKEPPLLSAAAIYQTFDAIQNLERPNSQGEWQQFNSSQNVAWKTGTSFGFRDAWAVGVTSKYAVGIWAGNADGEGRPGLVGIKAAAPVLFNVLDLLPNGEWFLPPLDEMQEVVVCRHSGYQALEICPKDTILATFGGQNARNCPFHQLLHLDKDEDVQVNNACETPLNMRHKAWFVLPPMEEYYYKSKHPEYRSLPPFREGCQSDISAAKSPMQLIYPQHRTKIFIPKELDGKLSRTVFKVAHRNPEMMIFWHLNNEYLGETKTFHQIELAPEAGVHQLTLVDEKGNRLVREFEIIGK
jgi:penicillin-binding protein 1C